MAPVLNKYYTFHIKIDKPYILYCFCSITGQTGQNAAKSCKEIKEKRPNTGSDVYWIKPDGTNPIQAYCDQQTDGGGWDTGV